MNQILSRHQFLMNHTCICHYKKKNITRWYTTTTKKPNLCPPGPGHTCGENHSDPFLVPHPPGPRNQRQHLEPQLSLEAGGGGAAAARGGASWRLGPPGSEAPQEHHLHRSPHRGGFRQASTAVTTEHCRLEYSGLVNVFRIFTETAGNESRGLFVKEEIENPCCIDRHKPT